MKKNILLVVSLMVLLVISASPALRVARATFINKTGYDLYVTVTEVENTDNVKYFTLPAGDKDYPETVTMDLHALGDDWLWYVSAQAVSKPAKYDANGVQITGSYNETFPCFGDADRVYWDDNQANRIFLLKGVGDNKNKVTFKEGSCDQPPVKWYNLVPKKYYYPKGDYSYVY